VAFAMSVRATRERGKIMGYKLEKEDTIHGDRVETVYWSMDEFADGAERRRNRDIDDLSREGRDSWRGASWSEALKIAREGWQEHLDVTVEVAESAVNLIEQDNEVDTFEPVWDLTGSEVDVARYLSGEPENMIDYPLHKIAKPGTIITLCASVGYSAGISSGTIIKRGQVITAFALALGRLGHSVEMWADSTMAGTYKDGTTRVLVKGANDVLDPARILAAYAHPSTLRHLVFASTHGWPAGYRKAIGIGDSYGKPSPPPKTLPEGTIYLPELKSYGDIPDAHEALRDMLRDVGLLRED
jgi:hypothetical protein